MKVSEIVKYTFLRTYPMDISFYTNEKSFFTQSFGDHSSTSFIEGGKLNATHPLRSLINFLGLPTRLRPNETDAKNIIPNTLLNLIDWHTKYTDKKVPTWRFLLDITLIKPILSFALNMISMIFKLPKNIVKLVTEFIPALMANLCKEGISKAHFILSDNNASTTKKFAAHLLGVASYTGFVIFKGIHIVGRAITSPYNSMVAAYQFGVSKFSNIIQNEKWRKAIGVTFFLLSAALTISIYAVLLPLVLTHLIAPIAAKIVTALPAHISGFVMNATNMLAPHLSTIGNFIHSVFSSLYTSLAISPIHTGVAIIASAAITTVGNALSHIKGHLNLWWRQKSKGTSEKLKIEIDEGYESADQDAYKNLRGGSTGQLNAAMPFNFNSARSRHSRVSGLSSKNIFTVSNSTGAPGLDVDSPEKNVISVIEPPKPS